MVLVYNEFRNQSGTVRLTIHGKPSLIKILSDGKPSVKKMLSDGKPSLINTSTMGDHLLFESDGLPSLTYIR